YEIHERLVGSAMCIRDTIYLCDYNKAYPITYKSDKFHGFDRLEIDYAPYHYYYSEDKEALKPYIGHVKYYSPDGRNDYYSGGDINDYLYYMRGRNGRDDLYLVGDNKCLGEIDGEFNGSKNAFNKLVSGQYVDSEGNLYEPIIVDGNVVALRNLMTGKYSIVKKINGLLEKQGGILYDELITNNSFYPRGFVGKTGNKAYWLSPSGRIEAEFSKDSTVQVDSFTIMDINGKFGIKKDGKIILEPNYDSITNVEFYDIDDDRPYDTKYRMVKKGDKVGLFDEDKAKIVIPLERGYSNICGEKWNYKATNRFEDSDLICVFTGDKENPAVGVWNLKLGKEVLKPSADNKIEYLPKGYKGYYNNNVAYSPAGSKLNLSPAIDVYQAEWGNGSPYFFTKMVGLEGRTIDFYITAYAPNGSVYKDRSGQKCIYKFSQSETPNSQIEYGPKVVHYAEGDVYLKPFSSITIKYVLSAKDAKTGASIPVKGEKSISMTFSRDW
ncbi:MAG: hypothetical protein K2K25_06325, partial [Muribaculaceae bacterium]|nr:hypothetical protein [Muribaculaceae bacterium]